MTVDPGRRRGLRTSRTRRRGSVLIQVGIALPLLLTGILGVMETGRVLWARNTLQFATEETARFAMFDSGWNAGILADRLRGRLAGIDPQVVSVDVVDESVNGLRFVTIHAAMRQRFVSFLGIDAVTISGHARVPAGR